MSTVLVIVPMKHGYRAAVTEDASVVPGAPGSLLETLHTVYSTPKLAREYLKGWLGQDVRTLNEALAAGSARSCEVAYIFSLGAWEVWTIDDGWLGESTKASTLVAAGRRSKQKDAVQRWVCSDRVGQSGVTL